MKYVYISLIIISVIFSIFLSKIYNARAITVEIVATVSGCGDSIIGPGEQCDETNFGGAMCTTLGFTGGSLSCTNSCTINATACTSNNPPSGGGGGGGGGNNSSPNIPNTNIVFTGRAYPRSTVTLLKDAQVAATTIADSSANFQMSISGVSSGNYIFSLYSEDNKGIRSSLLSFPVSVTSGVTTKVGGIFISPTLNVDKSEVKQGDNIAIFGQSAPSSEITINVNSENNYFFKKKSDSNGIFLFNLDSSILEIGQHHTRAKASLLDEITEFGKTVNFKVGLNNILNDLLLNKKNKADLNSDTKVNIVDFSIAAYWYKRLNPPKYIDINGDEKVDLKDFSIIAFNWTG
jgi:hypothetical protein